MKKLIAIILSLLFSLQLIGCSSKEDGIKIPFRLGNVISYDASNSALGYLQSSDTITVTDDKYITFTPKENVNDTGFIFYPGGLVEPEAYAPIMNKISQQGYQVIVVPMPMNLAIFDSNKAKDVIKDYPNIKNWVIGGHSLGGVMACKYAAKNPDTIKGVVLYASYPQNDELKDTDIRVLSLWGSEDRVAKIDKILDAKNQVNSDSEFIEIIGGNHDHFGDYGEQKGDGESIITPQEQWDEVAQYTVAFLESFND
ncbi:alpha/beta fold hydrolase [Clostridium sp. SM-530-WT-3G]|uniref:alpha/beta fold hydrolase n=1 Tax=Clostridium sp. SM-530-WT-3G TaxID=2725303 RepID=UPI00145E18B2|nr:alpha/beta fold hydrolase [Clostridium sp. SM-530-WT-3G]NME84260.1 alpha/beta fold hydrolase [Clostridium sp. SM-530-WT-3G]